jgi:tetratricopeptide (TPR) repeat protein
LLSGALPFDSRSLRSAGFNEIQRIIREVDPPRPSTKLSSLGNSATEIARCRQLPLASLARELKGELEWIPLKAMRKDRAKRYASATELADDIRNYLQHRPLRAGPESTVYRLHKFLRRNKRGVLAAAAMVTLLVGGIVATSWQAIIASRARQQAVNERNEAERQKRIAVEASENVREVNRFLTEDLLASASPNVTRGRELTVREALDRAASLVATRFNDRPVTQAAVESTVADTYAALGQRELALSHFQSAFEILRRERGPDDEQTILAARSVGTHLAELNRHSEAEPILRDAYEKSTRLFGPEHKTTLECMLGLAKTLRMQEKFTGAEPLYRKVLEIDRKMYGPESIEVSNSLNSLAVLLNTQRRASEAEPLYIESMQIRLKQLGPDHPAYLGSLANLARVYHDQGKFAEAEAMYRQALQEKRRVLKDDHPATTGAMNDLAVLLKQMGKDDEAEALYREALERRRRTMGDRDIDTLQSMYNLGSMLLYREKYAESETLLREALEGRRDVLGETHRYTFNTIINLAHAYAFQGKLAEAEPLFERFCQPDGLALVPPAAQGEALAGYGACLTKLGKLDRAEPILLDSRRRFQEAGATKRPAMQSVLAALTDICTKTNRPEEAAKWVAERAALASASSTQPTSQPLP